MTYETHTVAASKARLESLEEGDPTAELVVVVVVGVVFFVFGTATTDGGALMVGAMSVSCQAYIHDETKAITPSFPSG